MSMVLSVSVGYIDRDSVRFFPGGQAFFVLQVGADRFDVVASGPDQCRLVEEIRAGEPVAVVGQIGSNGGKGERVVVLRPLFLARLNGEDAVIQVASISNQVLQAELMGAVRNGR